MTGTVPAPVGATKITREELQHLPVPKTTETHWSIPHHEVAQALVDNLDTRHTGVVRDEYAVSSDGECMVGMLDLDTRGNGYRFVIGIQNAHSKPFGLSLTTGYRVIACDNVAFYRDLTPVIVKKSSSLVLAESVSASLDIMQGDFKRISAQIEVWKDGQISDAAAKLVIYHAFIEGDLEVPQIFARAVHDNYFYPDIEEFQPRSMWSLSNAFTSTFRRLDAIPQFRATAQLGQFFQQTGSLIVGVTGGVSA